MDQNLSPSFRNPLSFLPIYSSEFWLLILWSNSLLTIDLMHQQSIIQFFCLLTIYLSSFPARGNLSSADNLCKQFGPRSGPTECRSWSGSKLFDTLIVFLKEFFEKVDFEKNQQTTTKNHENYPACKDLVISWLLIFLLICLFVLFDSLRPINNLSVIKGWIFLCWTSTKLGLMFLLKDTSQWRWWGSNPWSVGLESSTLPLSHCAPSFFLFFFVDRWLCI